MACITKPASPHVLRRAVTTYLLPAEHDTYAKFAEPLRDRILERAHGVCAPTGIGIGIGIGIGPVNVSHIRKEDLVSRVLAGRGNAPGPVHVVSVMVSWPSYGLWLDRGNGSIYSRGDTRKCLHCDFHFIDEEFDRCCLRVPTWAPFGLQFHRELQTLFRIAPMGISPGPPRATRRVVDPAPARRAARPRRRWPRRAVGCR